MAFLKASFVSERQHAGWRQRGFATVGGYPRGRTGLFRPVSIAWRWRWLSSLLLIIGFALLPLPA